MNKWFHSRFPKAKRRFLGTKLALEILEDRLAPATFTVTTRLDVLDANDGKLSLREAITQANNLPGADTIVVPAGVYKISIPAGPGPVNDTGAFDILDSATLQGAGAGATIVDAQHIDRVFAVTGTAPSSITVTFRGLTVRGGLVNGDGGGIVVGNADLTLVGCVVTGNTAFGNGTGISNALNPGTGNLTLVGSTVSRNVVGGDGGGIFWVGDAQGRGSNLSLSNSRVQRNTARQGGGILADTATLTNSTVSGNSATTGNGGGIDAATATLTNSTVSGNSARGDGGGIDALTATLVNSTVSGNTASDDGGGIVADMATLTNSTVSGNTASDDGGGIVASAATLTNSTVSGNTAGSDGGGILGNTATLTNSTVSGNTAAGDGGGIFANTATLTNSTVSGNTAAGDGGGIWARGMTLLNATIAENIAANAGGVFHEGTAAQTTVKNTIIALNLVTFGGSGPDVSGAFTSQGHNLIGDGTGSSDFSNNTNNDQVGTPQNPIDPKLGPLANNGGPTKTLALLRGSPAIDGGDNNAVDPITGQPLTTDQRRVKRPRDGNGDGQFFVDIGAFER